MDIKERIVDIEELTMWFKEELKEHDHIILTKSATNDVIELLGELKEIIVNCNKPIRRGGMS